MRKEAAAQATSGRAKARQRADGPPLRELLDPPIVMKLQADPVAGARSLLQLRSRKAIEEVLADAEFVPALKGLAAKAARSPKAAVVLVRLALRPEFASAAAEAAATLDKDLAAELRARAAELLPKELLPKESLSKEQKPPRAPPAQADLMREAASTEADQALGRALQDMGALARQFEQLEAAVEGEAQDRARRAKGASDLVLQWVRQAARHRKIAALGKKGERVPFDPELHRAEDEASPGDQVRVVKPPIVRASGSQQVVVVRGEVELD